MKLLVQSQTSTAPMDKLFHPTLYNWCDYLSLLGLKLMHVSKMGSWTKMVNIMLKTYSNAFSWKVNSVFCMTKICSYWHSWQYANNGSGNGLLSNRRQAITCASDDTMYWHASPNHNALIGSSFRVNPYRYSCIDACAVIDNTCLCHVQ